MGPGFKFLPKVLAQAVGVDKNKGYRFDWKKLIQYRIIGGNWLRYKRGKETGVKKRLTGTFFERDTVRRERWLWWVKKKWIRI